MATATTVRLTTDSPAIVRVSTISQSAADKITFLLQQNHETHHITFDEVGRHNHIVHHLLASFSLGADAEALQKQYNRNASYQRPPPPADEDIISSLDDPESFPTQMTKPENYTNFLAFFTRALSTSSIADVANQYVFGDNPLARTIFNRFFAGYYHPLIHLGYGIEFEQPAIVAEALAQACIHSSYMDEFFTVTAEVAKTARSDTLVHLLDAIHNDVKLLNAVKWEDGQKVRDAILARAPETMISYAARFRVPEPYTPEILEEYAAEVIDAAAYFTGCAQNPPKVVKMDFFYMHAVTSSIFLTVFLRQDWISADVKARLIEWKGRLDLALYASRKSPKLLVEEVREYPPDGRELRKWDDMIREAADFLDDGHTVKFIRALKNGEEVCRRFESGRQASNDVNGHVNGDVNGELNGESTNGTEGKGDDRWIIKGDMWQRLSMMVMDSVQPEYGDRWARNVGFDEAWEKYPLRK